MWWQEDIQKTSTHMHVKPIKNMNANFEWCSSIQMTLERNVY